MGFSICAIYQPINKAFNRKRKPFIWMHALPKNLIDYYKIYDSFHIIFFSWHLLQCINFEKKNIWLELWIWLQTIKAKDLYCSSSLIAANQYIHIEPCLALLDSCMYKSRCWLTQVRYWLTQSKNQNREPIFVSLLP